MENKNAIVWTAEMDALLGTMSDMAIGKRFGFSELPAARRRKILGIPSYRSKQVVHLPCATCGEPIRRRRRDHLRSKKLYCSKTCAASGQKRRDTDMLRYGPGWKNVRAQVRRRDKVCRSCGKTPEQNGHALHVHHLKPFRFGGTNSLKNLVALCEECHHRIEKVTDQVLASIMIDVRLVKSSLIIKVDGRQRWPMSALGAASPPTGTVPSGRDF
jgi:5-methylcytosine-specific restriction endonuclease McrA